MNPVEIFNDNQVYLNAKIKTSQNKLFEQTILDVVSKEHNAPKGSWE